MLLPTYLPTHLYYYYLPIYLLTYLSLVLLLTYLPTYQSLLLLLTYLPTYYRTTHVGYGSADSRGPRRVHEREGRKEGPRFLIDTLDRDRQIGGGGLEVTEGRTGHKTL